MRTPHTVVRRGKRVKVVLKDGTVFIDVFVEGKGKWRYFKNHKILHGDIRSFTIYKPQGNDPAKQQALDLETPFAYN